MAELLKAPARPAQAVDERVRRDVAEMLLRIERGGERAVREYSRVLDGWDPPSFVVGDGHSADCWRLEAECRPSRSSALTA